jgi:uncharacterized protein (TIGR02186 family)
MIKKLLLLFLFISGAVAVTNSKANPIISGISTNEINIDTKFQGTRILLFGAKEDAGSIVIAVRGPKKNFLVTRKQKLLGIWYNGERLKFRDSYGFYSFFSTFGDKELFDHNLLLSELELGENNLRFAASKKVKPETKKQFQLQLIDHLEKNMFYTTSNKIDFLNETLFKVILNFPKNTPRGVYTVEIYLIDEGSLSSFQSIPIYVNQIGLSAKILDFAYKNSFLYGILAVAIALVFGWLANYLFVRFVGK